MISHADVSGLDLPELLETARVIVEELATRALDPGLADALDDFPSEPERDLSAEWGLYAPAGERGGHASAVGGDAGEAAAAPAAPAAAAAPAGCLPVVLARVEELGRGLDAARTGLSGHVDRLFDEHASRRRVLGIPEGKCLYRNGADYLRQILRIHRNEAKKRIRRAAHIMPRLTLDRSGQIPPEMPVLAEAVNTAQVDPASVDLVVHALTDARADAGRAGAPPEHIDALIIAGEQALGAHLLDLDPEAVRKACDYWRLRFDALVNPDGAAPTEAQVNASQGLYYRGKGAAQLHEWLVLATDDQHETIMTLVSAASNPRRATGGAETWSDQVESADALDSRSRPQQELDGLVSALTGALALTSEPDAAGTRGDARGAGGGDAGGGGDGRAGAGGGGGARPQVLVMIDYESLASRYTSLEGHGGTERLVSQAAYAGPVNPQTIRQRACDADLIPMVLGGQGEVLDVGRSQRLFTRKLRRAITARDGGCAAPACTIPAPWCEAHHIQHWEHGGPTSVDNGVLLCSHHHHAVHSGAWEIEVRDGVPWFIPARYHDPEQRPRRNLYWRPSDLGGMQRSGTNGDSGGGSAGDGAGDGGGGSGGDTDNHGGLDDAA